MLGAALAYLIAWSLGFVALVGEWRLAPDYLVWSFTGGGERAVYIQLFALIAIPFGALFGLLWHLYRARPKV